MKRNMGFSDTMSTMLLTQGATHPLLSGWSPRKSPVHPEQYHRATPGQIGLYEESVGANKNPCPSQKNILPSDSPLSGQSFTASLPNVASHRTPRPSALEQLPSLSHSSGSDVLVVVAGVGVMVTAVVVTAVVVTAVVEDDMLVVG